MSILNDPGTIFRQDYTVKSPDKMSVDYVVNPLYILQIKKKQDTREK